MLNSKRRKYNAGHNDEPGQTIKPQYKTTNHNTKVQNTEYLHKRDIAKEMKANDRQRQCKKRKNEDEIHLNSKTKK